MIVFLSCGKNTQRIRTSYAFFDERNHYHEIYITRDSVYMCFEPIPVIYEFSYFKKRNVYFLQKNNENISTFEIIKKKEHFYIIIDQDEFEAFHIKDKIHLSKYYSNNLDLMDEFYIQLSRRKLYFLYQNNFKKNNSVGLSQ